MPLLYILGFLLLAGIVMALVQFIGAIISAVFAWLVSIWWILLLVLGGIIGLSVWWNTRPSIVAQRKQEEEEARFQAELAERAELARQQAAEKAKKQADERFARLMQMPTAGSPHLIGYRISRQIRMVRVDDCDTDNKADLRLREEAEKAGANGIINMQIRPYSGGCFSAQGDAVILEKA